MVQDILPPEPSPEDTILAQAVEEIRQGQFAKARDLLTQLLRRDQGNATYWVWMSAAMETQKERLYCLQMAYKADPANAAARRGLILMGSLNPDDSTPPFPMNHPRPWEDKVKLADEKPKVTGIRRLTSDPVFRISAILTVSVIIIIAAVFGLGTYLRGPAAVTIDLGGTARPTVTPYVKTPEKPKATLPPLVALLDATYTPTPIYAATPRDGVMLDVYRGAMNAYKKGQWDNVAEMMGQLVTNEPGSVDAIYFIAEAKRLSGKYQEALDFYQQAIETNANFAPIYLGQARTNMLLNPKKDVLGDLDKAINLDKYYYEAYMERGLYFVRKNNLKSAKADLEQAAMLNSGSPLVQIQLARVLMALDEKEAALAAAQKAKELDITMLDAYLVLGMAYRANGRIDEAVKELETFTAYSPNNAEAFAVLGAAYYNEGKYETALKNLDEAIRLDNKSSEAYYWRGQTYLGLKDYEKALESFHRSLDYNSTSFNAELGVVDAYWGLDQPRNVYTACNKLEALVTTDKQLVIVLSNRARALEKFDQYNEAYNNWRRLLELPAEVLSEEMRAEAQARLEALRSPTPLPFTATPSRRG